MENEIDFSECQFIQDTMRYYTYFDFCKDRKSIKRLFNVLTKQGKLFYMWYVYANIHMELVYKNAIWNYLNGYDDNGIELLRLTHSYKVHTIK